MANQLETLKALPLLEIAKITEEEREKIKNLYLAENCIPLGLTCEHVDAVPALRLPAYDVTRYRIDGGSQSIYVDFKYEGDAAAVSSLINELLGDEVGQTPYYVRPYTKYSEALDSEVSRIQWEHKEAKQRKNEYDAEVSELLEKQESCLAPLIALFWSADVAYKEACNLAQIFTSKYKPLSEDFDTALTFFKATYLLSEELEEYIINNCK